MISHAPLLLEGYVTLDARWGRVDGLNATALYMCEMFWRRFSKMNRKRSVLCRVQRQYPHLCLHIGCTPPSPRAASTVYWQAMAGDLTVHMSAVQGWPLRCMSNLGPHVFTSRFAPCLRNFNSPHSRHKNEQPTADQISSLLLPCTCCTYT